VRGRGKDELINEILAAQDRAVENSGNLDKVYPPENHPDKLAVADVPAERMKK
jgi:hypothetical protein